MTLEEASKIQSSLMELSVDVEDFSWGPSYELAMERRKEALDIIYEEVNRLSKARSFNDYCDFRTTKLFNIITLIGFLIDHNPKDHLNKQIMLKMK